VVLFLLDLTGVVVFAISGALAPGRAGLDLLGVMVLSAVTAIGGTLRDVLMNRHPIFWMAKPVYLIVICVAGILTVVCAGVFPPLPHVFLVADAFGLGLFAISGAQAAEDAKRSPIIVVLIGMITGSAGGLIRDLLTAKIPLLLQRDIYATAAAGGIVLYLILRTWRVDRIVALIAGVATVTGLRVTAVFLDWQLPVFHAS
jgi:uncharacterized membrane protein YeiH